jgi:hypothetical protein
VHADVPLLSAAAAPEGSLVAVEPDLEDIYFRTMAGPIGRRREQPGLQA